MGVVNRRWVRVESMGGCKEVYRFPHITYLVSALFLQHPYFLFIFKNVFRSCSDTFWNLCKTFSCCINTHTGDYGRPTEAI